MQYQLWAEMVAKGSHSSLDTPPCVPMFTGGSNKGQTKLIKYSIYQYG